MSKKLVKIFCVILSLSMIISAAYTGNAINAVDPVPAGDTNLTAVEQIAAEQGEALAAFFMAADMIESDEDGNYPDGYGGCYINDNNELIFQIKEGYAELKSNLQDKIGGLMPVDYNFCKYSVNDLRAAFSTYMTETCVDTDAVARTYLDVENNRVEVIFEDGTMTEAESAGASLPVIAIEESDYIVKPSAISKRIDEAVAQEASIAAGPGGNASVNAGVASLTGGNALYNLISGSYEAIGTWGFAGTYGGANAYVTAGHCVDEQPAFVGSSSTINSAITCTTKTCENGAGGDFGIVTVTSSTYTITRTNQVKLSASSTGTMTYYYSMSELPTGTQILKYGITTGLTVGTYSPGITWSYDNNVGNVVGVEKEGSYLGSLCWKGDSGGPVWCLTTVNNTQYRALIGVVSGYDYGGDRMFYCPIRYAYLNGFRPNAQSTSVINE